MIAHAPVRPAAAPLRGLRTPPASRPSLLSRPAVVLLLCYLAGITIIGKGPTYLGVPPLFWGELVMAAGVVWIAPLPGRGAVAKHGRLTQVVSLFLIVGFFRTLVDVPAWGLDAVRDAAIWFYALFYFIGLSLALQRDLADKVWSALRVFWICALFWGSAEFASGKQLSELGPIIPSRGVTILMNARDDIAQNLALGAMLVIGGLSFGRSPVLRPWMKVLALVGLALFAASEGRAVKIAFVSALIASIPLCLAKGRAILFPNRSTALLALATLVAALAFVVAPELTSVAQLDRFADLNEIDDGTAGWRKIWWQILADTTLSRNPLFGLGFGESLHRYHPILADQDDEWIVRSPHNFNVTIFARMGSVGLLLWALALLIGIGTIYVRAFQGHVAGRAYSAERREELVFWIFMLLMCYVNSSFGVLMEGPVLGIWFWFALGFATGRSQCPIGFPVPGVGRRAPARPFRPVLAEI